VRALAIGCLALACAGGPPSSAPAPPLRIVGGVVAAPAAAPVRSWRFRQGTVRREQSVVRVLLYHSFGWFSDMRPAVTPYALRTQLDWLDARGIEVIPLGALLDFLDGTGELPEHAAVITIDDGELNGVSVAEPILRERGVPFTLAIATEAVEQSAVRGTIPWPTLRQVAGSEWVTIGSHSHTHRNLTTLSDAELQRELEHSRDLLRRHAGVEVEAFFHPLGGHDARVRGAVEKAGYRASFTAQGGRVTWQTPRYAIPRYAVEQSTSIFRFARFFRH
jgi:peptidoglycan/xylan/chitin deacetylase (PgdA/CDA1 family)